MTKRKAYQEPPPRPPKADNGMIRLDAPDCKIKVSTGVVFNIHGVSPSTLALVQSESEKRYPLPPRLTIRYSVSPEHGAPEIDQEIISEEEAELFAKQDPERYGDLAARFRLWRSGAEKAVNKQNGLQASEMIRYGTTIDADATRENGAFPPDFELTWRDRVPQYGEVDEKRTEWEKYLTYAIGNVEDFGAVSGAVIERTQAPTAEGVAAAVDLFRARMAEERQQRMARLARASGNEGAARGAGVQADDAEHVVQGGDDVGDEPVGV